MIIQLSDAENKELSEAEARLNMAKKELIDAQNSMRQRMLFIVKSNKATTVKGAEFIAEKKVIVLS